MEAETGVMWPAAQGQLGPPEAGGGKEDPPQEVSEEAWPPRQLDLGLWPSELGENTFLLF